MNIARQQDRLLCLYCFMINFEFWDPLGVSAYLSPAKVCGWLYGLSMVLSIAKAGMGTTPSVLLTPFIGIIALTSVRNMLTTGGPIVGPQGLTSIQNLLFAWLLIGHAQARPLHVENAICYFAFGASCVAVLHANGVSVDVSEDGRMSLMGDNPNAVALRQVMALGIIGSGLLGQIQDSRIKCLAMVPAIPAILALTIETGSRTGLAALSIVLLVILFCHRNRSLIGSIGIGGVTAVVSLAIIEAVFASETMMGRIMDTLTSGDVAGRDEIWQQLWPIARSNWLFGLGETGYASALSRRFGGSEPMSPHNVFLEILLQSGICGLALFCIFLRQHVASVLIARSRDGNILPLIFFVPIVGVIVSAQLFTVKAMWLAIAYTIAQSKRSLREYVKRSPPASE
jgi:O-antigen ligase